MITQFTKNRNSTIKPSSFFAIIFLILIILLIVFNQTIGGFLGHFVSIFSIQKGAVYGALPKSVLASRLLDAEEEISKIKYQSLLYTLNLEELNELKNSLGLPESEVFLRANIISRPPRTNYDTILVSYKEKGDLEVGDLAFVSGVFIGSVAEVNNSTAIVSMLSSPGNTLDIRAGDPSAIVVGRGLGGGAFSFDIPKEVLLSVGDVVSTGSGDSYVVAVVSSVIKTAEHTTARVYANTPININNARVIEFKKQQK